jgi:hypothetical protein
MNHRWKLFAVLLAGTAAAAACGGDEPTPPDEDLAPNLSGTYDLTAFSALPITGGTVLEPPDVSGIFVLQQDPPTSSGAMGTFELSITFPDGLGGTATRDDEGTYTVRTDGSWEQISTLPGGFQAKGTYTFQNGVFTAKVTEPALAVSTTVWQRR